MVPWTIGFESDQRPHLSYLWRLLGPCCKKIISMPTNFLIGFEPVDALFRGHEAFRPNCSMTAPVVKRGLLGSQKKQLSGSGPM